MSPGKPLIQDATEAVCAALVGLGVGARLIEDGLPLRRLGRRFFSREAHGFIRLGEGPIAWVNVTLCATTGPDRDSLTAVTTRIDKFVRYGVPDPSLGPAFRRLKLSLSPERSLRRLGKATELRWRGNDARVVEHLNSDQETRSAILSDLDMSAHPYTEYNAAWVSAYPNEGFWLISTPCPFTSPYPLSAELWRAYESIASGLLAVSKTA